MTVLSIRHVHRTRGQGRAAVRAVNDISLDVHAGELVLVHGPSGSGKTTLLALAGGLLSPDAGTIRVDTWKLDEMSAGQRRRLRAAVVGFVFQRPSLLERLTVRDNILLQSTSAGVPRARAVSAMNALLDALALRGLAGRTPSALSGGEQQRAAVARALVHRPRLILADEPTASLDSASGLAVARALANLAQEYGSAVLIATHDPRLSSIGHRTVRIADGRLEED